MKPETIAADIRATLATRTALAESSRARASLLSHIDTGTGHAPAALEHAIATRNAHLAAEAALKRIPAPRRAYADNVIVAAERIARSAARNLGGFYSGRTEYCTEWGTKAEACTTTTAGEQYTRGCTYKKTDAVHWITLDPAGVALLAEDERLQSLSEYDGLRLIALYPDNSAVWAKSHGKAIVSERGWIFGNAAVCYHSIKSREHAEAGFQRKLKAHMADLKAQRKSSRENRRARLVARLCGGITATLADAKAAGYCEPGIKAFQAQYGIGDSATLPQLVRTGNPSAVNLALRIARNARRETVNA